ncbi:MAG: hypothetical protein ACI8UP_002430, partial [Porticoccaceae bacterium]
SVDNSGFIDQHTFGLIGANINAKCIGHQV